MTSGKRDNQLPITDTRRAGGQDQAAIPAGCEPSHRAVDVGRDTHVERANDYAERWRR